MAWFGQYLGTAYTGQWWGDQAAPPPVIPSLPGGGGFPGTGYRPDRDDRKFDRDELRAMLEAAFADAPRDPVVKQVRRSHPVAERAPGAPRVDWSALLSDLTACERVLKRYAERIAVGKTRTQRGEKAREDLRYSQDTVAEMVERLRVKRRRRQQQLLAILH